MLKGGDVKEIYEKKGSGFSIRGIADDLGIARNTVRRYLRTPEAMRPKPRQLRGSKLDPYMEYIDRRMVEGLENCRVLQRELRTRGYGGSYTILAEYVRPRRQSRQPKATVRFDTAPGEQAQVDWGSIAYIGGDGRQRRVWAFVMVLGWSRAIYVEFVRRAATASFIRCHINAFGYLGGVPRGCLYDNAKVVPLGRDPEGRIDWNQRMLDFSLRVGFELKLCQPYRAQTKGKVEIGVKYVRGNLWPSLRFTDDADLNRQTLEWCDQVANAREHGTTHSVPWDMLAEEQPQLGKLPEERGLAPYLREDRTVARDGYVSFEGSRYGVHWQWAGSTVQVGVRTGTVEVWAGDRRIAMHPGAQGPGQRFTLPGQWAALPTGRGESRQTCRGGAGGGGRRGTPLPGGVRTGSGGCAMTTINLEQARQHLETLGLKQAVEVLDNTLDLAASKQLPYADVLAELLGVEVASRRERYLTTKKLSQND